MPAFTSLVLQRIWEAAEYCPLQCLEWLTMQVPRNKLAHSWVLQSMDAWVEKFLLAHTLQRVRNGERCPLVKTLIHRLGAVLRKIWGAQLLGMSRHGKRKSAAVSIGSTALNGYSEV